VRKRRFKIKLLPGESVVWVGRQWAVTTLGMEMIRPPYTWVGAKLIPNGMTGTTFDKHGTLGCLSSSWYMDVEDLISAYTVACRVFSVPTHFLTEASTYARTHHAAIVGDYPALMPELWKAANPLAHNASAQFNSSVYGQ
jgi:hypothetical protein